MSQEALSQKQIAEAAAAFKKVGSKQGAARLLGLARSTFQNRLAASERREVKIKILLLDIETAPNLVHVWALWQQNVSIKQIIDAGYVLCWSAKWYGEEKIYFDSIHQSDPKAMLVKIHKMLDECDAVIHYNGAKFDIPTLNKEFLLYKMKPPAPYKQIDLLRTARSQFRFPSNKLDYIAQKLKVGKKHAHAGHQLWIDCMAGKKSAWSTMKTYNMQDVTLLEGVYEILKPWIKNHPNVGLYNADPECCPTCGSTKFQARGEARTIARTYQRYMCKGCGAWFRGQVKAGQSRVFAPA